MTNVNRLCAVFLITIGMAISAPIYGNGTPNTISGNEATAFLQAEDFTLSNLTSLTGVRFWAFYFNDIAAGYLGSVDWGIYSDNNGQPGSALFFGLTTPVVTAGAANCCVGVDAMLEFTLPNAQLAAGTYWLALHNGPASQSNLEDFYWQTTNANATSRGVQQASPFGNGSWATTNLEHAFELDGRLVQGASGEVPEASTFILSGLALVFVSLRRRFH